MLFIRRNWWWDPSQQQRDKEGTETPLHQQGPMSLLPTMPSLPQLQQAARAWLAMLEPHGIPVLFDPYTPHGVFAIAAALVAAGTLYIKRRIVVDHHLTKWESDADTLGWNVAHILIAPPVMFKTYDVTQDYAPLVPHRALVVASASAAPALSAVPSDATLPRDFFERLDGRRPDVTVSGRRLPPPKRDAPSVRDSVVSDYVKAGEWRLGLAAVDHLQRSRPGVSAADADAAVIGLLRANRRHQALTLMLDRYAAVPFSPSTYAELLRKFSRGHEERVVKRILAHITRARINLGSEPELFGSALGSLSAVDWEAALELYAEVARHTPTLPLASSSYAAADSNTESAMAAAAHRDDIALEFGGGPSVRDLRPTTTLPPALGTFQVFCRNLEASLRPVAKDGLAEAAPRSSLDRVLADIAARYPQEHVPAVAAVLGSPAATRAAAAYLGQISDDGAALQRVAGAAATDAAAVALARAQPSVATSVALVARLARQHGNSATGAIVAVAEAPGVANLNAVLRGVARPLHLNGTWMAAAALAKAGVRSRQCDAVPALTHGVAVQGRWGLALKLCTQAFSLRKKPPTSQELGVCVYSSVMAGRWAAALFWVERAHARGMRFHPSIYDAAFSASGNTKWAASLRAFSGMAQVGGTCTEAGVRALLKGHAEQDRVGTTVDVITATNNVQWER